MSRALIAHRTGPGVTVQDFGRPGFLADGLSRGGAADRVAIYEGAALLGQSSELAVLEMAGFGGEFLAATDLRVALTGAPMQARIDGDRIAWSASHALPKGARLSIGGTTSGTYGYLHVGGGIETPVVMGARGAHLTAGLGRRVEEGTELLVGNDSKLTQVGLCLDPEPRFEGGLVRVMPGPQTRLFAAEERDRFVSETFRRDTRGNRMGVRLVPSGMPFTSESGLTLLSEIVVPGDIQITGDGTPFVLLSECQTTGGYPRIGTVLPADLPRVAQATAGMEIRFKFLTVEDAAQVEQRSRREFQALRERVHRLVRDPHEIRDLLSYQLISGVITGDETDVPLRL